MSPRDPSGAHNPQPSGNKSSMSLSSSETHAAAESRSRPSSKGEKRDDDAISNNAAPHDEPAVEKKAPEGPGFDREAEENYKPKTFKFWSIVLSAFVSMFIVALDRTILSTAIPAITNDFNSLGDIGWYGSAYMLTTAAFQLVFGRIYKFYDLRNTFIACILLFEIGSAICGAAPNSTSFIIGRAIAGLGSAGIFTGCMMTIIPIVPLHKRPMFQSIFGMVFGISSICGPLIGGAFTERVTWRWCFYMNLPIGAVAIACQWFFQKPSNKPKEDISLAKQFIRLDPLGTFFFVPSMVCLLLALEWGGSTYPWSNWRIIVLFVIFGLTAIAFCTVQVMMPETATIPLRIIKQRTILAGTLYMFFVAGAMMLLVYYIPLWFQATKGVSPVKSGLYTIPLVASMVVSLFIGAGTTQKIGYYVPVMILCPCIMTVGEGLLSTFTPSTGHAHWIAYQFLVGFGLGLGMQTVGLAVQATLPKEDVSTGMAMSFFSQQLGGAVFVSVGQTILNSLLIDNLQGIPGLDPNSVVETGATQLRNTVPKKYIGQVVGAYNDATTRIFLSAVALSIAQLLCALCMEWRSIKKPKGQAPAAPQGQEGEKAEN